MNQAIKDEHIHETPAGRKLFFADVSSFYFSRLIGPINLTISFFERKEGILN